MSIENLHSEVEHSSRTSNPDYISGPVKVYSKEEIAEYQKQQAASPRKRLRTSQPIENVSTITVDIETDDIVLDHD